MSFKNISHINFLFTFLLSIGFIIAIYNAITLKSPSNVIEGTWKEVSWEYEKPRDSSIGKKIDDAIKKEISKELIIHQAEVWQFVNDGRLTLNSKNNNETLFWTMKGRGNILKLSHHSSKTEHYNIQLLNKNKMILYFNTDIQAKGIVKMTFERINENEYAQKI